MEAIPIQVSFCFSWYFKGFYVPPSSDVMIYCYVYHRVNLTVTLPYQRSCSALSSDVVVFDVKFDVTLRRVILRDRSFSSLVISSIRGIQKFVFTYCPSSRLIPPYFGELLCRCISSASRTDLSKFPCIIFIVPASSNRGPLGQVRACWAAPDLFHSLFCIL